MVLRFSPKMDEDKSEEQKKQREAERNSEETFYADSNDEDYQD